MALASYAQGEANIWYFGKKAGLDFNSGSPVVLTDGVMNTDEGCATISDANGHLLFYTDGVTVWNKNHQIMPNGSGLKGHPSSTQSAVIVPNPEKPQIYYIFTTTEADDPAGARYSEVDLSLNAGLGDVTSNKNILLFTPTCEKITAVKNYSSDGYWVILHGFYGNRFYSYSVTKDGVSLSPVINDIGVSLPNKKEQSTGSLKISPDGTKLISCNFYNSIEMYDFDTNTGKISNPKLVLSSPEHANYGLEFSATGDFAYVTYGDYYYCNKLLQFDLKAADIPASSTLIYDGSINSDVLAGLQMATNGIIYGVSYHKNYLYAINNPDAKGAACNFQLNAISLGPDLRCNLGLPSFIQSYFITTIHTQNNCVGDTSAFSLSGNQSITTASWNFGDGNTSTDINPTHAYTNPGTYTVSVTATSTSGTSTKTKDIVIYAVPTATQPPDILVCDANNDGFSTFDLTSQNTAILNGQDPNLFAVNYLVNNVVITNPAAYSNAVAYQEEVVTAEVYNKVKSSCKSITSFKIDVFDTPKLNATVSKLSLCDNTSVGTDSDGKIVFDLSQKATEILNEQFASQFLLSYYKDATLTQSISNPTAYANTNATETIYVKVVNKDNLNCVATTSFPIEVMALPTINSVVDLKQCDDDTDGFSVFNLEEAITKITSNAAVETISFYKTMADAQNNVNSIVNKTAYTNQTVSVDKVFVRVANSNGCYRVARLNLIVSTTQIPATFFRSFTQCDDLASGSNTDGIAAFDFSNVDNEVRTIFPSGQILDISYYRNLADALAEKNAISNIANYSNIGYPNTQNIYIRVDSRLNNDCLGLGSYITLNVEAIPIVAPIAPFVHCDDDQDGYYAFDVSGLNNQIKNGKDVTVRYFDTNNNPLPSPLPNPFVTQSQTIKVSITNNTTKACSYDISIKFVVDKLPQAFTIPATLTTVCDDEVDPVTQDGKYAFDTSTFQNTILGSQTGMIVKYFDENNNVLPSPLPNPFVTDTQNIRVEVINPINTTCSAEMIIPFVIHPVPNILLEGDELVCSNLPTFTKVINAGIQDGTPINDYSYSWSLNGTPLSGENNYELTVNTKGTYTVKVANREGCSRTRTIWVNASDIAVINNVDIIELSDSNSITVSVSGSGDYVFALDDEFGVYQEENNFTNVSAGIHTVFVKDRNGCGVTSKEVAVLGIPNYFTPNQDGYNDTWNIRGSNTTFNSQTIIYIFDRYGRLIKQISPIGNGWDGTFNSKPMPAADYWYSVKLENGKELKGHFSLKR